MDADPSMLGKQAGLMPLGYQNINFGLRQMYKHIQFTLKPFCETVLT